MVRLLRGDFAAETVYDADPVAVARGFEAEGAPWIHVVDLDAARTGEPVNLATVAAIAAAVTCPVQTGGGVRSVEAAAALLGAGVARVVVGTAAVEHPELVDELGAKHPGRVAVGLDARGQDVAVRGWVEGSGTDLVALGRRFAASGVAALIVTEIGRDGTLEGPDLGQLATVLRARRAPRGRERGRRDAGRPPFPGRARGWRAPARRYHRWPGALRRAVHGDRSPGRAASVSDGLRGRVRSDERETASPVGVPRRSRGLRWMRMA